jgi:predicted PilT family ATPase
VDVDVASDSSAMVLMDEENIGGVIGKGVKTIDLIEKKPGFHLDIRERKKEKVKTKKKESGHKSSIPAFRIKDKSAIITMRLEQVVCSKRCHTF